MSSPLNTKALHLSGGTSHTQAERIPKPEKSLPNVSNPWKKQPDKLNANHYDNTILILKVRPDFIVGVQQQGEKNGKHYL
jgi:hypothetical protein